MNKYFRLYCKADKSNNTDSVFSIIGSTEPDLTKSLGALLFHSKRLLTPFVKTINKDIPFNISNVIIKAEQRPDLSSVEIRRDISIFLNYEDSRQSILIVIEAKNPSVKVGNQKCLIEQLDKYFDPRSFSDVNKAKQKIGVTLTKERQIIDKSYIKSFDKFYSLTWEEIFFILESVNEDKFSLENFFINQLRRANFMKTYEEEVFCPPVGLSFGKVDSLSIYCCPADRTLKDAIYLMPRIPVNGNEDLLRSYNIDPADYRGKGFAIALYKVKESFVTDLISAETIEDCSLRKKVIDWFAGNNERLKVFVLGERMNFDRPKFTEAQNNTWNGYFKLSEVWGDVIPKRKRS